MRRWQWWTRHAGPPLALALLVAMPLVARADDPPPPPSDQAVAEKQARAQELIRQGVELRLEGKEIEAFERFREAHELDPSPRAAGQMGLAAKSLRRYVEAERWLAKALAAADDPWVQKNREALEQVRDAVAKQLASLTVTANVEGAELFVNGERVGTLPLASPLRVAAGVVTIELRAPGHAVTASQRTLPAGLTLEVRLEMPPVAPTPPPPPTQRPIERPVQSRASLVPWIIAAGGVGVVGTAIGGIYGLRALSLKEDRDVECPENPCRGDNGVELDKQARTSATVSTIGFAAGGAALAAAAVLLFFELRSDDTPTAKRSVGLTANGRFVGPHWTF